MTRPNFEFGGISALWPSCAAGLLTFVVLWVSPATSGRLSVVLLGVSCALIGWAWMHLWAKVPMSWATAALVLSVLATALVAVESRSNTRSTHAMLGLFAWLLVILTTAGAVAVQSQSLLPDLIDHQVMSRQSAASVIGPARQSKGPEHAKYTFVIFLDPTCTWTLKAYREAAHLVATHPDVRLVVRPVSFGGYYAAPRRYVERLLSLEAAHAFWKEVDALADVAEAGSARLGDHVRASVLASDEVVIESPEARQSRAFAELIKAKATPLIFVLGPDKTVRLVKRTTDLAYYIR